jgi:hypothetical protein
MNRIAALTLSAGMITMAACSDSPTAPATVKQLPLAPSMVVVGDEVDATPVATQLKVCKTDDSNIGGSFTTTSTPAPTPGSKPEFDGGSGNPSINSPQTVAPGECRLVAIDMGDANEETGDFFTVTEGTIPDVTSTVVSCTLNGGAVLPCPETFFINTAHGWTILVRNILDEPEPPADVCDFSTFGGFVLLPNNISYGGNAGRISDPPGFAYGSLNFKNHTNGDHIHVWNVTDYGHPEDGPLSQYNDSRLAFGLASVNGGPVNVPVEWRFVDLGEPAKKKGDAVYLKVGDTVLIPEQVVVGGNIQLHAKCKKAPKAEKH